MEFVDDRSEHDGAVVTHRCVVMGRDRFMSGWGKAEGGYSWAGWACKPEDRETVERWVHARGDMKYQRTVIHSGGRFPTPRSAVHMQVYMVHEGHNALKPFNPDTKIRG